MKIEIDTGRKGIKHKDKLDFLKELQFFLDDSKLLEDYTISLKVDQDTVIHSKGKIK